jgi:UDP-GlcNAc:undecaprenyl-phosphate GlcNAc-1-phosphate transferase
VLIVFCYYAAYVLRFEQSPFLGNLELFKKSLTIVVACHMVAFFVFGVYRGLWRYVGVADLVIFAKGAIAGNVASILVIVALYRFDGYSRSLFVINTLLVFLGLAASRISFRLMDLIVKQESSPGRKTIIYGAGDGGAVALRELLINKDIPCSVLGFIDDDETKHRRKIHGYPVLGGLTGLETIINTHKIKMIVVASQSIRGKQLQQVRQVCTQLDVDLKRLNVSLDPVETVPFVRAAAE